MRDRSPRTPTNTEHLGNRLDGPKTIREFCAAEIDLDDLAEAVRLLLGRDCGSNQRSRPTPDLLFLPPRVTHVVEATEAS
jgi:hypothetical protein